MSDTKYELLRAFPTYLKEDVIEVLSTITQTEKLDFSYFEVDFCGRRL